jgi:outer membrane protein assembly factor BamB
MSGKRSLMMFARVVLLLLVVFGGLSIFGCVGIKSTPEGGSGVTIADGALYLSTAAVSSSGGISCSAPSSTNQIVALDMATGNRLWAVDLQMTRSSGGFGCSPSSAGVAVYGTPAVEGDIVYIGGYDGKVYAISISTRLSKQKYLDQANPQPIIGGPIISQGKVYIGSSDGKVYALTTVSLDSTWNKPFETGDKIWATPTIDAGTLYIGSFDKKLYALNAADGSKKWEFATEGAIVSTPLVDNGTVYFGSFDRYFYAVGAADGNLKWKYMGTNWFWAQAVAYNNVIYAPSLDGKLYILDTENGHEVTAPIDLKRPLASSPLLVNDLLIIASEEGKIFSVSTSDNQVRELADVGAKIYAPISASGTMVYVHTGADTLYGIDVQTGAKRELNIK